MAIPVAARNTPAGATISTPPKTSLDTDTSCSLNQKDADNIDGTAEFAGELDTNDRIPSQAVVKKIEELVVLDRDGKTVPFRDIYNGPNVARRVLVIFIRHFFCGVCPLHSPFIPHTSLTNLPSQNCQEFIRTLSASISSDSLLNLPTPTFIAIIGCGAPELIPMWISQTSCPFPCYADPTKKLYDELGMLKTLNLGPRPEYQRQGLVSLMTGAFVQSLKMIKSGRVFQGGGYQQVGGEFLFEPVEAHTPMLEPGRDKQLSAEGVREEKRITWCHRMRTTRDHAEIPEIREVLGLDGERSPGRRKGTGLSSSQEGV